MRNVLLRGNEVDAVRIGDEVMREELLRELLDDVNVREAPRYMELSPETRTESYVESSGYYVACIGIGKDHVADIIMSHESYDMLMGNK